MYYIILYDKIYDTIDVYVNLLALSAFHIYLCMYIYLLYVYV
jgi:hypothetical protein